MYIFKEVFVETSGNDEILMGFGLKHRDNVSAYYVSPYNKGNGQTYIAKPIGDGINLGLDLIKSRKDGSIITNNIFVSLKDTNLIYAEISPSEIFYESKIFDREVSYLRLSMEKSINNFNVKLAFFDDKDILIPESRVRILYDYWILPIFAVISLIEGIPLKEDSKQNKMGMTIEYFKEQNIENFVKGAENLYQKYKNINFEVFFGEVDNKINFDDYYELISLYTEDFDYSLKPNKYDKMEILKFDESSFSPLYQKFIPQIPKELIMDKELKAIANAIYLGDCLAFLQHGQTGTGKTINCKLICEAINLPILETINCTENLDEFVLGKYLPSNDGIYFCESFVTKAIRDGGAVIFEEINFAKPQYLAFLNSLLDDNGFVRLDNNEIVKRNKNFRFFATMNYGYFGTKDINQALYNRFQIIYKTSKLTDEKIKNMLLSRVPSCSQYLSKMLKVYHKISEKIEREELDFIISPRNLESWARLASQIGYVDAAKHTITQISKGDLDMEESIMNIIHLFKWT